MKTIIVNGEEIEIKVGNIKFEDKDYYVKPKYANGVYYDRAGGNKTTPSNAEIIETLEKHFKEKVKDEIRVITETGQFDGRKYYFIKFNFEKENLK